MSMINEFVEKLIERLEEYKYTHLIEHDSEECLHCKENEDDWCSCRNCHVCLMDKVKEIIKQLSEEYATDTNVNTNSSENLTSWIPCEERLPEEETKVIVSTKTERVKVGIYTKRYGFGMREGFICDDGFMYMNTAIAWMPLTEPYKGE